MVLDMTGKTVVISGASRGIGYAIAEKFAALGANLVLGGTSETVDKTAESFRAGGANVVSVAGDISKAEDAQKLIDKAIETFGTVDVLINNAGITRDKLIVRMDESDWDQVMDTNLKGAFLLVRAAAKVMMKKRTGRIINISSVVGVMGNPGQSNYTASKAGLIGFTKSIAKELSSRGINCNAIAPGFIETAMTSDLSDNLKENYLRSIPLGRYGTPSEVADLAVFLASPLSTYITGQVIHIDGGLYM
jgi:3-oxoacyl-[acyl-carrier protein] reductase